MMADKYLAPTGWARKSWRIHYIGVRMATLVVLSALVLQVAAPGEMTCLGFIKDSPVPMSLYVSGTEEDEVNNYSHTGSLLYVNGSGVPSLKAGQLYAVIRPEGRIKDRVSGEVVGIYHKELGTVRVEVTRADGATASVVYACNVILKGDLLVPATARQEVRYDGKPSDSLTPFSDQGLASAIVLGKDGVQEMGAGNFCFIAVGSRDGVQRGDRFTIYRPQPPFDPKDLETDGSMQGLSYSKVSTGEYRRRLMQALRQRTVPPRVLGDIVVLETQETTAVAKIVNSLAEVHTGDVVVRR